MSDGDLTIHQAIAEVINELEPIGKTGFNKDQKYNFRGIDAILGSLHPLLSKYGVFFAPEILERIYEERVSKQGTVGHCAHLHVRYTVYGPTGDSITLSTWGEGLDYSDKATNKAMTAAFKYALSQLFAICDPSEDGDREGGEGGSSENEPTSLGILGTKLAKSDLGRPVLKEIMSAAIGRPTPTYLSELSEEEVQLAIRAIDSAVADRHQLEEERT
jgi:hypothetical protein